MQHHGFVLNTPLLSSTLVVVSLFLCSLIITQSTALYSSTSSVKILGDPAFKNQVKNSDDVWLVEFFAPWCGHCKQFAPEYEKAAAALKGIVKVAAVEDESVISGEQVQGFPTVKLFLGKGNGVVEFKQARNAAAVVDFVTKELTSLANKRLNKKKEGKKAEGKKAEGKKAEGKKAEGKKEADVIVLTDDNFKGRVLSDEKSVWFVEFYAPWCGHCKALAPTWEEVGKSLKGRVKVAKVDATENGQTASLFSIKGYPTIMLFPSGPKSASSAIKYEQARDLDAMVTFALGFAGETAKAAQLLSNTQFQDECSKGVCIIAFLPHLLDSGGAKGRQKYIGQLDEAVKSSVSTPVKFFWVEGGKNLDLEESLRLQFGWPAVIATRVDKSKYTIHKGDFSSESIRQFIVGLMSGRSPLSNLPAKLPPFSTVPEWDGKDPKIEKPTETAPDEEL